MSQRKLLMANHRLGAYAIAMCLAISARAQAQCSKDVDCKGDRICVNGACVDPPARSGAPRLAQQEESLPDQAAIRSHLEQRLTSESQGALTLEAFEKTNGYEQEVTHFYVIEWRADIRFTRQGWKPGDAIGGYWNDFQVIPAQGGFMSGSWIHFDQGARVRLTGTCSGRRTEKGWRLQELEIRSYQKLAQGGATVRPPSGGVDTPAATGPQGTTRSLADMQNDLSAGKEISVPIKYVSGAIDSPRFQEIFGGLYLADGLVRLRTETLTFEPTVGAPGFKIAPTEILTIDNQPAQSARLHLKIPLVDKNGKAKPRDFYFFHQGATTSGDVAGAVGGGGASILCTGCDQSIGNLYALIDRAQRGRPEPLATPPGAEALGLSIAEPIKDFGTVSKAEALKWTFEIRNTGSADVEILAARPLCACTQTSFTKVIKAGTAGSVTATVNVSAFSGPISKIVEVITNDPRIGTRRLTIKAVVSP